MEINFGKIWHVTMGRVFLNTFPLQITSLWFCSVLLSLGGCLCKAVTSSIQFLPPFASLFGRRVVGGDNRSEFPYQKAPKQKWPNDHVRVRRSSLCVHKIHVYVYTLKGRLHKNRFSAINQMSFSQRDDYYTAEAASLEVLQHSGEPTDGRTRPYQLPRERERKRE